MITTSQRKSISVADHMAFRESLAEIPSIDDINELLAEIRAAEANEEDSQ